MNVLFLDTEGLDSTDRDATFDSRLFALTLLLCSTFVFNAVGSINGEEILQAPDTWRVDANGAIAFAAGAAPEDCAEVQIAYRTRDLVQGEMPLVFDTHAPICALNQSDIDLDLQPRGGCTQTPVSSTFALLLLLGFWRRNHPV